jgi:hypothetical protein
MAAASVVPRPSESRRDLPVVQPRAIVCASPKRLAASANPVGLM